MILDFIFLAFKFLLYFVTFPLRLIQVSIDMFFFVLHMIFQYLMIFYHLLFLDVIFPYVVAALVIETGIFGVHAYVAVRSWIRGHHPV